MPAEAIVIKDANFRVRDKNLDAKMKKAREENLQAAAEKEQQLLEKRGLIDIFLDGIDKVSELYSQKKKKEMELMQQKKNSKEK